MSGDEPYLAFQWGLHKSNQQDIWPDGHPSYLTFLYRTNPSCFLFLVDQSGSMVKPFGDQSGRIKAQGVADAINRLLQNLVLKCAKSEGMRDYFHVGVIGYGSAVGPAFGGALANRALVPISEIAHHPLRVEQRTKKVEDGAGGLVEEKFKFPLWFEPTAEGKTPMCQALALARKTIAGFVERYPACYPPLVMNITDGMATDGSPEPFAPALGRLDRGWQRPGVQRTPFVSARQAR